MIPYTACMCWRKAGEKKSRLWVVVTQEGSDGQRQSSVTIENGERDILLVQMIGPPLPVGEEARVPLLTPSDPDWVLLQTLDTRQRRPLHTGRFLTLHKRRRRRLSTRSLEKEKALLDDILHGQSKIQLERIGNWNFNAFTLDVVAGGRSLPVLCLHLFHLYGLMEHFRLDPVRVWKLFTLIDEGYHSTNPYHNAIHAADVTQAMHCFLQEHKMSQYLTPLEAMTALLAAVTHDLDHPGVNQPFLVATSNHLAALYKNSSVLENHHWRSAVGCLLQSGVAAVVGPSAMEILEEQLRSLILATDITRQAEFINRLKHFLDTDTLDLREAENRHFVLQIALKCADICNPCRPWDISKKWSFKVCEEFFRQGDYERRLNLPVTSMCDRQSMSVPRIQAGFFKFVVSPLFVEWHRWLASPLSTSMIQNLLSNQARWDSMVQQELAEETQTEVSEADTPDALESDEDQDAEENEEPSPSHHSRNESGRSSVFKGEASLGRRHSVPISNIRPVISRTIIRRESLPMPGQEAIALPTSTLFHMEDAGEEGSDDGDGSEGRTLSCLSLCSGGSGTAEGLLPEPSIANMASVQISSAPCTHRLARQQTFPPLQTASFRARYFSAAMELSSCSEEDSARSSSKTEEEKEVVCHCPNNGCGTPPLESQEVDEKENLDPYRSSKRLCRSLTEEAKRAPILKLCGRRGSAPVTALKAEDMGAENRRTNRRGSAPVEVLRTAGVLRNVDNSTGVFPSPTLTLVVRRGSLPFDAPGTITNGVSDIEFSSLTFRRLSGDTILSGDTLLHLCTRRGSVPVDFKLAAPTSNVNTAQSSTTVVPSTLDLLPPKGTSSTKRASLKRKKQLKRRSSGGPELFTRDSPPESGANWKGTDSTGFTQDRGPGPPSSTSWSHRRGSLPMEAFQQTTGTYNLTQLQMDSS